MEKDPRHIIGLAFIGFGGLFLLVAIILTIVVFSVPRVETTGIYVSVDEFHEVGNTVPTYYPVIAYETREGQLIQKRSRSGSSDLSRYPVGKELSIWYAEKNPESFRTSAGLGWLEWGFYGFALVLTIIGGGIKVSASK